MSGARKLLLSGGALTVLLALVAIASRAHRPGGGTGGEGGSHVLSLLGPYVATVGMLVLLVGTVLIVWALAYRRREQALAGRTNWRRTLLGLAAVLVLLSVATLASDRVQQARRPPSELGGPLRAAPTGQREREKGREAARSREEQTSWLPLVVISSIALGILLTTGAAIVHRRRHRDALDEEARLARALDEVLADTLDDLRAERDPRKAVIRAYARMEQTFAAYRVPREPAETPLEYVARVLDRLHVSGFAVRRLTQLFERAKFSKHAVDAATKEEAIDVLVGLRAELEHDREEAAA